MLLIAGIICLFVLGLILFRKAEEPGIIFCVIAVFCLVIALISWPIWYFTGKAEIQQYYAVKQSIEQSRVGNVSDIERAALTTKIVQTNSAIASNKYWNGTTFDIFIPDELANLEYLK